MVKCIKATNLITMLLRISVSSQLISIFKLALIQSSDKLIGFINVCIRSKRKENKFIEDINLSTSDKYM